jgi:hypothetical protein
MAVTIISATVDRRRADGDSSYRAVVVPCGGDAAAVSALRAASAGAVAGGAARPPRGGEFGLGIDTGLPPYGAGSAISVRRPPWPPGVIDVRSFRQGSPIVSTWLLAENTKK